MFQTNVVEKIETHTHFFFPQSCLLLAKVKRNRKSIVAFPLFCERTIMLPCTFVGYIFNFVFDILTN